MLLLLLELFGGGWWFRRPFCVGVTCNNSCLTCGRDIDGGMVHTLYVSQRLWNAAEMKLKLPWANSCFTFGCQPLFCSVLFCCRALLKSCVFLAKIANSNSNERLANSYLRFFSWFDTHSMMKIYQAYLNTSTYFRIFVIWFLQPV